MPSCPAGGLPPFGDLCLTVGPAVEMTTFQGWHQGVSQFGHGPMAHAYQRAHCQMTPELSISMAVVTLGKGDLVQIFALEFPITWHYNCPI